MKNRVDQNSFLNNINNIEIFQKTHELNHKIALKFTELEMSAFNVDDEETIRVLLDRNSELFADALEELVNYTICHACK